ncbi:MAG: redox-regulated ATPase YchF [Candidatus Glassbacteria bacterium]
MSTSMGIVGLPNVGKSTIFNALTAGNAQVANYPFTTIDANVGIVEVPDEKLDTIAKLTNPAKLTHATIEFIDIAGLVEGASHGEGLGNQFLAKIREVDAICHILRCFEESDVSHVSGKLSPLDDMAVVDTEFRLADVEVIQRRIEKARKKAKGGGKEEKRELEVLSLIQDAVSEGAKLTEMEFDETGMKIIGDLWLLSMKPVLYVLNIDEAYVDRPQESPWYGAVAEKAESEGMGLIAISGKIEAELSRLSSQERASFYSELGIAESSLTKLIRESRDLLDLITFYTIKGDETKAWNIKRGMTAVKAAGKIHSDIEKGFIKAEVIGVEDFIRYGSMARAREEGVVLIEGREYIVRDGDILLIKFKT